MATAEMTDTQSRRGPYGKLLHRFYEPLLLLKQLAPFRRDYILNHPRADTKKAVRRQFLKNLAYICDFNKGGFATTAIGLEQLEDSVCFWIAQNKGACETTQSFLEEVLTILKQTARSNTDKDAIGAEQLLLEHCLGFAKPRITRERALLLTAIECCVKLKVANEDVILLLEKLERCKDPVLTCQIAFQSRHCSIRHIASAAKRFAYEGNSKDGNIYHISNLRHRLGRLSHHVRVVHQLVEDYSWLCYDLENFTIACVPNILSIPKLEEDNRTTIPGIITRLLPKDDPAIKKYEDVMFSINYKHQVFDEILKTYRSKDWKLQVHCEIQVLEHFYSRKLEYVDNDRYIGCSKMACLCCRLYFRHHPARCIEPESHQKIYINWGPPLLTGGAQDPGYILQRNVINKMVPHIREAVIEALEDKYEQLPKREDSITEISSALSSYVIV